MNDQAGTNRKQARRSAGSFVLYVLAAAAAAFAAWQMQRFYSRPEGPPPASRKALHLRTGAASEGGDRRRPATNPSEWIADPLSSSPLRALHGDPEGLAPPSGAVRVWAHRGTAADQEVAYAQYTYGGPMSAAVTYYRLVLARRGFRLLEDRADGEVGHKILAFRDGVSVNVTLRKPPQNGKMAIVVIVSGPEKSEPSPATQQGR